ncbi:hypothetical protein EC988_004588 [Linderina pennispora]|nr:hypothetical protein EC988_004588 [Linderina pennispora]
MNFEDTQVVVHVLPVDEELPPYTPFQPTFLGDDLTVPSDTNSLQIRRPASGSSSMHSVVEPTELHVTANGPLTRATQVLDPTHSMQLTFEGFAQTRVLLVADDENRYGGYLFIDSRFEAAQEPACAVSAASKLITKPDERILEFGLGSAPAACLVKAECRIVVPSSATVPAIRLRLPANSHLAASGITCMQLARLDLAAVACVVRLRDMSLHSLRLAVADGRLDIERISVQDRAEFIAIKGEHTIAECTAGQGIRINAPEGRLEISNAKTTTMSISAKSSTLVVRATAADKVSVQTTDGLVTLEDVTAATIAVESSHAPVRGSWTVSKALTIEAEAAIVQGRLTVAGDDARIRIRTSRWPVRLAVSDDYTGYFDIRSANSIVNFGLAGATFYECQQYWRQGVIGIAANVLEVESTNSPVVITTF